MNTDFDNARNINWNIIGKRLKEFATDRMYKALSSNKPKLEKYADIDAVKEETMENKVKNFG